MTRHGETHEPLTNRRSFITSAVIASAAASIGPRVVSAAEAQAAVTWKAAPCRMCGVGCGLLVGIEGGRAVAVKGDPTHPVNQGLACVKGYYAIQSLYARDRLTRALVRQSGTLTPTPMAQALDLVAARLRDVIARHGPDSVALYGSAQWTAGDALIAARVFRGAIGSRNVDTSARLHGAAAEYGLFAAFGATGSPGCYEDVDHADVFILWDLNLAETDPVLFSRLLERRRLNPATRIIDVATRTTRTSYAADRALLCAPQSVLAIANAICHDVCARRAANREFVNRHVAFKRPAAEGAEAIADVLANDTAVDADWTGFVSFLEEYSPDRVQRLSGMPAEDIRWLASLYSDPARRVVSLWGDGVNRQHDGAWASTALHNIHLLVGKVATPGNAAFSVSTQPGGLSLVPDLLGHQPAPEHRSAARRSTLWGTDASRTDTRQARTALSIFRALDRGEIRFLWIQATNPMVSLPNLPRFRAAARRGAFIVVSDAYPTATTDFAHVVLPAALWIERDRITVNGERRLQWTKRLVPAPGDSMSDGQQLMEVARRLGYGKALPWDAANLERAAWQVITRAYRTLPDEAHITVAGTQWPVSDTNETRRLYNAAHDAAAEKSRGFDFYGHADRRAWIWFRPWNTFPGARDRDFPFWLSTGDVVEHWGTGTLTRRIPTLHRAVPRAYVELHRLDARDLGVRDGDIVRLTSRVGSIDIEARIDHRGQPQRGCVFVPAFDENAPVNMLMPDDACPVSGQIREHGCAVRITRVRSGS